MANICGNCDRSYYSASIRGCGGCDDEEEVDEDIEFCDICVHSKLARECSVKPFAISCSVCPNVDVCDIHCINCKDNINYKEEVADDRAN